jgi:LAS superfamily LD-carboxypeptidase LdcB
MPRRFDAATEALVLTGQTDLHLCTQQASDNLGARIHAEVVSPFQNLKNEASEVGFDLRILSGFRGFEQQLSIWNRKASGELPVLDSDAVPIDINTLRDRELVFAILRWSALPGASRHHWGTDLDIYDAASRPEGYEIKLIPEEVDDGGMFGPLHAWLDERIAAGRCFGFYRPYDQDRGGVATERWHISHEPLASFYAQKLSVDILRDAVENADLKLKKEVLQHLEEIYNRFVMNINRTIS